MSEKLIHWRSTPEGVCARKDAKADETSITQDNGTKITWAGEADHLGNVTCGRCLSYFGSRSPYED